MERTLRAFQLDSAHLFCWSCLPARLSPPVLLVLPSRRPRLLSLMEKTEGARRTMAPCLTFPQAIFRSGEWSSANPLPLADSYGGRDSGPVFDSTSLVFLTNDLIGNTVQRTLGSSGTSSTSLRLLFEAAVVAGLASTFLEESF
jgi:hypothetical protein